MVTLANSMVESIGHLNWGPRDRAWFRNIMLTGTRVTRRRRSDRINHCVQDMNDAFRRQNISQYNVSPIDCDRPSVGVKSDSLHEIFGIGLVLLAANLTTGFELHMTGWMARRE
jgi:hypothetical protein